MGAHRVQLAFEAGAITLTEPRPPEPGDPDARLLRPPSKDGVDSWVAVRVDGLASRYDRALANGARILRPPTNYEFGERQYVAEDIAGHRWTLSEPVRDVEPKEWGGDLVNPV